MEENKNLSTENALEQEEKSAFDFQTIYTTLILNWKWFVLSLIICLGIAAIYLRYKTPVYQAYAKMLIKDEDNNRGRNSIMNATALGTITNSAGIDNEMEILKSRSIAEQAVRDLKLYTTYMIKGKVKETLLYKNQPISVDVDPAHLEKLSAPINLQIVCEDKSFHVTGTIGNAGSIDKTFAKLPATINTREGMLTFTSNTTVPPTPGATYLVTIRSPRVAAYKYAGSLSVGQSSKTTTIAQLVLNDEIPQRAVDYLKQLAECYNRQANEDKNEVAVRTEAFINSRLEKINAELGNTEGQL